MARIKYKPVNSKDIFDWCFWVRQHPEDYEGCPWEKFTGTAWAFILRDCPQFADRCDWSKFKKHNAETLLMFRPEFADKFQFDFDEESIFVSPKDKAVYDIIKRECEKHGVSRLQQSEIGILLGLTRKQVFYAFKRLQKKDLIHSYRNDLNHPLSTKIIENRRVHLIKR